MASPSFAKNRQVSPKINAKNHQFLIEYNGRIKARLFAIDYFAIKEGGLPVKSKLGTLLLLTLMLVSMGVVTYAGSYTHQVGNFYNQHVQSGMENIGYEVISPSYTNKTEMEL